MENKYYIKCDLSEDQIFGGYIENYAVGDDILKRLSRDLGFSFDLYRSLSELDSILADGLVRTMSTKSGYTHISVLVDPNTKEALGYSLDADRPPVLNVDFMKRVSSLAETCREIKLTESYIYAGDTKSSVILKKVDPIELDTITGVKDEYEVGILVMNDELDTAYCRLVIYRNGSPLYLPASYYSASINRYKKSTKDSSEALEVLILKVIDDLRGDELKYKIGDLRSHYNINKNIAATYEEYTSLLRTMKRIPSVTETPGILDKLTSRYEEFEQKYSHLEDQKSSYIWRCTAIGDLTIGSLVDTASKILVELGAPVIEYHETRELLGNYLGTKRIVAEIAKESI